MLIFQSNYVLPLAPAATFTPLSSLNLTIVRDHLQIIATLWFKASRYEFCGGHKHSAYKATFKQIKKEQEIRASGRDRNYTKNFQRYGE